MLLVLVVVCCCINSAYNNERCKFKKQLFSLSSCVFFSVLSCVFFLQKIGVPMQYFRISASDVVYFLWCVKPDYRADFMGL